MSKKKSPEFKLGYAARGFGQTIKENPSKKPLSRAFKEWVRGWRAHQRMNGLIGEKEKEQEGVIPKYRNILRDEEEEPTP